MKAAQTILTRPARVHPNTDMRCTGKASQGCFGSPTLEQPRVHMLCLCRPPKATKAGAAESAYAVPVQASKGCCQEGEGSAPHQVCAPHVPGLHLLLAGRPPPALVQAAPLPQGPHSRGRPFKQGSLLPLISRSSREPSEPEDLCCLFAWWLSMW